MDGFRIPVGSWVDAGVDWLRDNLSGFFDVVAVTVRFLVGGLSDVLLAAPIIVVIVVAALLAWLLRSWKLALGTVIGFALILAMGQWVTAMQTLALVLVATIVAVAISVPLGIWSARNSTVRAVLKPILDFMQTMPAFVYLIPAITFFSIGVVPGVVSTVIFALPPGVRLTELGIRGVRFFMIGGGVLGWDDLEPLAAKVAAFGWHVQMQMDGRLMHEAADRLARLPGNLIIDHNGKFLEPVATDHAGFLALRRLIDGGRTWVKTSGVYETSRTGAPDYADVAALARALIGAVPERCLFATNWPHPSKPGSPPDDARLIDLFADWCGDAATAKRIMVDNAAEVYGFAA